MSKYKELDMLVLPGVDVNMKEFHAYLFSLFSLAFQLESQAANC
jgi:hypothetical protein